MTRTLPSVRVTVATIAVAVSALVCAGLPTMVSGPSTAGAAGGTALPAGWELCILQGVGAPATQANVDDLDEWQTVEGGSTNNSAAYNPFNTRRTTDANNNPVPETISANGFPAFANWLAGCAATVGTLFQPNMWSITAALRSGNVSPPGAFLAAVDQSQWCAPDANGTPCYQTAILGVAGNIATAVLTSSAALDVYGNVKNDVRAYELSVLAVSNDQDTLTARSQALTLALAGAQAAQTTLIAATKMLRRFAIDEYVSTGLYDPSFDTAPQAVSLLGGQNADGVVAHQYETIAAANLVQQDQAATAGYKAARTQVHDASQAVEVAMAKLNADGASQTHSLAKLVADVATMQTAGACTAVTLTSAPLPGVPGSGPDASTTTTTTTTTPPVQAAPATTTTTSTTAPAISSPAVSPPDLPTTTTTDSTTTTTTTTVPPTTTTTTTAPASPNGSGATSTPGPPAAADPAGFTALQGCMAVLSPPAT